MKKYLPSLIPGLFAVLAVVAQAGDQYVTHHQKLEFGGLMAALVGAIVNHWITSPKD